MKTILGAIALTLAIPAIAQTAPATDPHAAHKGMDHSKHLAAMDDCMKHCEEMKKQGKMECMEKKGEAKSSASAGQQDHHGHAGHSK